jgi:Protein of unknown function (DUF551)
MKWIKCSERLPEIDQTVLCFMEGLSMRVLMLISYKWKERGLERQMPLFKDLDRSFDVESVNSWMPLPDPPKDK